jgi:uncharacterized protein YlxP (DUF503 family)
MSSGGPGDLRWAPSSDGVDTLHVGVLRAVLHVPAARSLKDSRRVIVSLRDRVRSQFAVSFHELPAGERADRRVAVVTTAGSDARLVRSSLDQVRAMFESCDALVVSLDVDVFGWHPGDAWQRVARAGGMAGSEAADE